MSGMGGPVDLNIMALYETLDRKGLKGEDSEYVFHLVYSAYQSVQSALREKREEEKGNK